MTLQEVTRKINKLVYPERKLDSELIWNNEDPTLEDVLVVLRKKYITTTTLTSLFMLVHCQNNDYDVIGQFDWKLTKPLSQQSNETIETIIKILE